MCRNRGIPRPGACELGTGECGTEVDVFSSGVTLAEVASGRIPGEQGLLVRSPRECFCLDETEAREAALPGAPLEIFDMPVQCCEYDPGSRPLAIQIATEIEAIQIG